MNQPILNGCQCPYRDALARISELLKGRYLDDLSDNDLDQLRAIAIEPFSERKTNDHRGM